MTRWRGRWSIAAKEDFELGDLVWILRRWENSWIDGAHSNEPFIHKIQAYAKSWSFHMYLMDLVLIRCSILKNLLKSAVQKWFTKKKLSRGVLLYVLLIALDNIPIKMKESPITKQYLISQIAFVVLVFILGCSRFFIFLIWTQS